MECTAQDWSISLYQDHYIYSYTIFVCRNRDDVTMKTRNNIR